MKNIATLLVPFIFALSFLARPKKIFIFVTVVCLIVLTLSIWTTKDYQNPTFILTFSLILLSMTLFATQIKKATLALSSQMEEKLNTLNEVTNDIEEKNHSLQNKIKFLEKKNLAVSDLYEMTQGMSSMLHFSEIFKFFCQILAKNFSFIQGYLVILQSSLGEFGIEVIYKISQGAPWELEEAELPHISYYRALEYLYRIRESAYIDKESKLRTQFGFSTSKSIAFFLLKIENRVIGTFILEGLAVEDFDKLAVFSTQFALEFKKVNLYEEIEELATTDSLTGLYVRRKFLDSCREELERAARHKMSLAFLMFDIDHFKTCNDRFGHLIGDYVLKETASILKTNLREIDLIGRYGGEEFSVILPDTDREESETVVNRILEEVRNYEFSADNDKFKVTLSCGVANFPQDAQGLLSLVDCADRALYAAKNRGRNCSVFYGEISS